MNAIISTCGNNTGSGLTFYWTTDFDLTKEQRDKPGKRLVVAANTLRGGMTYDVAVEVCSGANCGTDTMVVKTRTSKLRAVIVGM